MTKELLTKILRGPDIVDIRNDIQIGFIVTDIVTSNFFIVKMIRIISYENPIIITTHPNLLRELICDEVVNKIIDRIHERLTCYLSTKYKFRIGLIV